MNEAYTAEFLGERLFHFWGRKPMIADQAYRIFASIAERGLLLTRGSGDLIDRFSYVDRAGQLQRIEVIQNARICFTDIPEDKLACHIPEYGNYAVGFSRRTILEWGGCPVWYLPNHIAQDGFQQQAGALAYGLSDAIQILNGLKLATGGQLAQRYALAAQALLRISSFWKEMSCKEQDDHRYLYEREWRIVSGLQRTGPTGADLPTGFERLTATERAELLAQNPKWAEPLRSNDPGATSELTGTPIINDFRLFRGIPNRATVAQSIEVVIVPDDAGRRWMLAYIEEHPTLFRASGPEVRVLA